MGLSYMQRKIQAVDPEFIIYTDTTPLVNAQRDYPKPVGFQFEICLSVSTDNGGDYDVYEPIDYQTIRKGQSTQEKCYAHKGRFFALYPTPTGASDPGIRLEWVPCLSMGADADVPDIVTHLHEGIVYRAEMIALGDTAQEPIGAATELKAIVDDIPLYYHKSGARAEHMRMDFTKWDVE